jgi:hypothetical protein
MKYYLFVFLGTAAGIALGYTPGKPSAILPKAFKQAAPPKIEIVHKPSIPPVIDSIVPPAGYQIVRQSDNTFGQWLQHLPLRKNNTLYLHDGSPKSNQTLHFAILDVPYNRNPLQQCADAVMRLRAEYLYATKVAPQIRFYHQKDEYYTCDVNCTRPQLENFLNKVFSWCGTYNLQTSLHPVKTMNDIQAGDVLVKGGSPGHAMLVAAVAKNKQGKKVFTLLQSFIPAQDIHVVINPYNEALSPWYEADTKIIATPGWTFLPTDLKRW